MAGNVIEEYLVGIGADIDTGSFNSAMMAISQLGKAMNAIKGAAPIVAVAAAIIGAGKAAYSTIKDVAAADMEYKKLASQMWITKDSAKSLSTTMKVMGVSQEDIAWIPELREQFFRLRNEMNELATPVDADNQLQWIREIGYDVQSLQVKLKMLKEWIAYYLIKYLQPYIKEFQQFIQWLNDKLGKNMPEIARKIAKVLSQIVSIGISAVKVLKAIFGSIYDFIESLPANVRKWAAIFAMVGAIIMSGPFGLFIAAIGDALTLSWDIANDANIDKYGIQGVKRRIGMDIYGNLIVMFAGAKIGGIKGGSTGIFSVLGLTEIKEAIAPPLIENERKQADDSYLREINSNVID